MLLHVAITHGSSQMSDDLIIGETSQIARYMPQSMSRVSARNVPSEVYEKTWDNVYVTFAEQRTRFCEDPNYKNDFFDVNVRLTLDVIRNIKSSRVVYFSTTELWNECNGPISIETPYNFRQNYYTDSKHEATRRLNELQNVVVLYPFNFNSVYRSDDYLFGKVVSSILEKKKISVGSLEMHRDILHASWVAERTLQSRSSQIIGSGAVRSVRSYIHDVYSLCGLDASLYIEETSKKNSHSCTIYLMLDKIIYEYETLLKDTVNDIQDSASKRHHLQR